MMLEVNESSTVFKINRIEFVPAFFIVLVVTLLLCFTDLMIGTELSFSIFYLLPITLSVFLSGRKLGYVYSVLCSLVWIAADLLSGLKFSTVLVPIWNTLVRFGYFIIHTIVISRLFDTISRIKETSFRDPLTQAANWRYFEEYSNKLIKSAVREKQKVTIVYIDVDNFKRINDTFGHSVGDEVLITISRIIQGEIRPQDLLARLGGDEFSIILSNTDRDSTREILNRIVEHVRIEMETRKWDISLSIGAMVFSVLSSTVGPMLKNVDDIMYEVKKNGKNNMRVVDQV